MNQLIQADIFFFITATAVTALALIWVIILIYVIKIVRDISKFTRILRKEAEELSCDLDELREEIKTEGKKVKPVLKFLTNTVRKFAKGRKK